MATQFATVEVVVLVDAEGQYDFGNDEDEARTNYEENVGALNETEGFRLVKIKVKVPLPEIAEIEVEALAPALEDAAATA